MPYDTSRLERAQKAATDTITDFESTISSLDEEINLLGHDIEALQRKAVEARSKVHQAIPTRPGRTQGPSMRSESDPNALKRMAREMERSKKQAARDIKSFNKEVAALDKEIANKRKQWEQLVDKQSKLRGELRKMIK